MQVTASAKNLRLSPEKVRLLVEQIKKMTPAKAMPILDLTIRASARPLKKVIASAVANAKNNYGLDEQTLSFKEILVAKGPVSKRFQPVARGRAHPILKRTTHITVVLEGEQPKRVAQVANPSPEKDKGGMSGKDEPQKLLAK